MPAGRRARRCSAHTSASPASLKRRTILGQLAARSPRHHEASDGNGAFARTVSAIPGPSTRMAAATSATSRVSTNATLSSPACPPQVGGSPWWESVRTISASTCASPASLFPPDTWPSWPVPPQQRAGPRWPAACCRGAGVPTARRLAACHSLGPGSAWSPRGVLCQRGVQDSQALRQLSHSLMRNVWHGRATACAEGSSEGCAPLEPSTGDGR